MVTHTTPERSRADTLGNMNTIDDSCTSTRHATSGRARVRARVIALLALAATLTISACSSDDTTKQASPPAPGRASAERALEQRATVIDVRTPEEYAEGHIEGAELINFRGDAFTSEIAALDSKTTYVVYCRTGNRSAKAATQMRALGLTVLDGGSKEDMIAAGWTSAEE